MIALATPVVCALALFGGTAQAASPPPFGAYAEPAPEVPPDEHALRFVNTLTGRHGVQVADSALKSGVVLNLSRSRLETSRPTSFGRTPQRDETSRAAVPKIRKVMDATSVGAAGPLSRRTAFTGLSTFGFVLSAVLALLAGLLAVFGDRISSRGRH